MRISGNVWRAATSSIPNLSTKKPIRVGSGVWRVDRDPCVPGSVIFLNAEDDPADTLRPRLEAAGADLGRVQFVDGVIVGYAGDGSRGRRPFSIEEDLKALDSTLSQLQDVA